MLDLNTQPCMVSAFANFAEITLNLAEATESILLLPTERSWTVAVLGSDRLKTFSVFPVLRLAQLDYISLDALNRVGQTHHTLLLDRPLTGYTDNYFPLIENQQLKGVLYLQRSGSLAPNTINLLELQCAQMALMLRQASTYYHLVTQQSSLAAVEQSADLRSPSAVVYSDHTFTSWQNRYEAAGWASGQILYEWNFVHNRPTWGPNTEAILGYSLDAMPSNFDQWSALVHIDDRAQFCTSVQDCIENRLPLRIEYRIRHADGEYRWVEDRNHVFVDPESFSLCVVGFIIDIHGRKLDEERLKAVHQQVLRANRELECATRLKDEFLACMSHELRTPLNSILTTTELLLDEIRGSLNSRQKTYLKQVERSSNHLLALINDVLEVAKIEAGKLELEMHPVDVQKLCESSLDYIRQSAVVKSLAIVTDIPTDLSCVEMDERRMRQVLINLLSNAIKFTEASGQISMCVRVDPTAQYLEFVVQDTGIGIRPEHVERLFQPFIQIDSQLSRNYSGTGLGLVLVKKISELHGGQVWVESEFGQGSSFYVQIPYRQLDRMSLHQPFTEPETLVTPAIASQNDSLILLAEDNAVNAEIFVEYLEAKGYQTIVAKDGDSAIQLAVKHQPDLMLIDIQMPKKDGFEVIQTVRTYPELSHKPIVALTALAMKHDQERCIAAGADAYLAKPVQLKQMYAQVQSLLKLSCENGYGSKG